MLGLTIYVAVVLSCKDNTLNLRIDLSMKNDHPFVRINPALGL